MPADSPTSIIDHLDVTVERWPLSVPFRIARGAKTEAIVVVVTLRSGHQIGRGECCPYPRYGETVDRISAQLASSHVAGLIQGVSPSQDLRRQLVAALPPGSARNALDCALFDLEAKLRLTPAWQIADLPPPEARETCFTLSLDTPQAMAATARRYAHCPLLKLKLGDAEHDGERMRQVRAARPDARLVADANEGWSARDLDAMIATAGAVGIEVIEQPLPASDDAALAAIASVLPTGLVICADESAAPGAALAPLAGRYQAINIKLDKAGGLTAAQAMIDDARRLGFAIMIGSMVSTSLSMAPAALLGAAADWIDLDSPLLLARDRADAMTIENGMLSPPSLKLWG